MDISVVKTVLGDFGSFVDALVTMVEKFPKMVEQLAKVSGKFSS
ncbi:hypothetical protein [Corynebacterium sp. 13CS0277]|nr:hypothetical protein [Corynebacterium sp. 13CS0277]